MAAVLVRHLVAEYRNSNTRDSKRVVARCLLGFLRRLRFDDELFEIEGTFLQLVTHGMRSEQILGRLEAYFREDFDLRKCQWSPS